MSTFYVANHKSRDHLTDKVVLANTAITSTQTFKYLADYIKITNAKANYKDSHISTDNISNQKVSSNKYITLIGPKLLYNNT